MTPPNRAARRAADKHKQRAEVSCNLAQVVPADTNVGLALKVKDGDHTTVVATIVFTIEQAHHLIGTLQMAAQEALFTAMMKKPAAEVPPVDA